MAIAVARKRKRDIDEVGAEGEANGTIASHNSISGNSDSGDRSSSEDRENVVDVDKKPKIRNRRSVTIASRKDFPSENLYNGDILELQVQQLLQRFRAKHESRMVQLDRALRRLKNIIEKIPEREPQTFADIEKRESMRSGVQTPFPSPRPNPAGKNTFSYAKPTEVNVVGSYAIGSALESEGILAVDLAVTMPASIFQNKDFLNYRYFHKRAYYLSCLADGIAQEAGASLDLEYVCLHDNHLQPIILVRSKNAQSHDFDISKAQIKVILTVEDGLFPATRLMPDKICIRSPISGEQTEQKPGIATPFYNSTLRSECCTSKYVQMLHSISAKAEGYADSCLLGNVWLQQRGFGSGCAAGGFGPFEWACVTALLIQGIGSPGKPSFGFRLSGLQLFRGTLQFLSKEDSMNPPGSNSNLASLPQLHHEPIFLDKPRSMNILFKTKPWTYHRLRQEAQQTLKMLNDPQVDHFQNCFISRVRAPNLHSDWQLEIPLPDAHMKTRETSDARTQADLFCSFVFDLLRKGLSDRVTLLNIQGISSQPWEIQHAEPLSKLPGRMVVEIFTDPENSGRTIDRGPSAEDREVSAAFRALWGEKAELRRFNDGSIVESVVWQNSDAGQSILGQIIDHLLSMHLGSETAQQSRLHGRLHGKFLPLFDSPENRSLAHFSPMMKAFDRLEKQIRALDGMPLQVRQFSAADSQLRYTSVDVPKFDSLVPSMCAANVNIQFEGSHRWPNTLPAIQRTKIAFLAKIGELLEASSSEIKTRIMLEERQSDLANLAVLEIHYAMGAFYHLRIHHEHEQHLLEQELKMDQDSKSSRETAAAALAAYKRDFVQAPLHTSAVRTLINRTPLFSPTIRLMKRWRDSHLLSDHLSDELIELLTIRTFVQPYPWREPGSLQTGFLRTLHFISKWQWQSEPLIVDFKGGEMRNEEIEAIKTRFQAWRKIDPAMNRLAIFAASNVSTDGTTWTDSNPSKVIAARFQSLAQAASALVRKQGLDVQYEPLFTTSLTDYDFVIHLNPKYAGGPFGARDGATQNESKFKNLIHVGNKGDNDNDNDNSEERLRGFNPTRSFLNELRALYKEHVIFFSNKEVSSVIAGLWAPQTGPRPWKVGVGYSIMPCKNGKHFGGGGGAMEVMEVEINKTATLNDIARLGGKLVSRIEVRDQLIRRGAKTAREGA